MQFFSPFILTCLALLTYVLYFMIEAFPSLDRLTSFAVLAFVSFGATSLILMDGVRRARSGKRVVWSYLAFACTFLLTILNVFVWFVGEIVS